MDNKKIFFMGILILFLAAISVNAVTVVSPTYIGNGNYRFSNPNSVQVSVTISSIPTSVSASKTQFDLPVSGEETVKFSTSTPGGVYFKAFVKYADTSASASLEYNLYASDGSTTTTTIPVTTTTIQKVNCGVDPGYKDGCYNGKYRDYYCYDTSPPSQCPVNKCLVREEYCDPPCCTQYLGANGQCVAGQCIIPGNEAPIINSYEPTNLVLNIHTNENIQFKHTSSDINNDTLTYRWLENGQEKSTSQNWTYSPSSTGTKNITLVVSDSYLHDTQEWSVNVQSTTATTMTTIKTTTTTITTTTTSSSGSGGSGGSGGGTWGGSGSTQTTGFYDFESFIQVEAGKQAENRGIFYSKYKSDQQNVEFKISGINENWYTISPSSLGKISYEEKVDIKITFNIPKDTSSGDYPFEISVKIGTISYIQKMTLVVTASQATTTIPTTTTLKNSTSFEGQDEESSTTGFFVKVGDAAKKYWFIPLILVVLFLGWKFLFPLMRQGTDSFPTQRIVEEYVMPEKESNYLELRQTKPKAQIKEIVPESEVVKKSNESFERSKKKVIDEIRRKAMEEDKNLKK